MDSVIGLLSSETIGALLGALLLYGTAMLGSLLMYFYATSKGLEGTIPKLKQLLPDKHDAFYHRLDFFMVVLIGPVVGLICFKPLEPFQALTSGVGWVAALNVLVHRQPEMTANGMTIAPSGVGEAHE